ncbi:MAG: SpoIIE family protein phosphatase [Ignavibacteriaceae bacterium]
MNETFAVILSCLISLTQLAQGKEKQLNITAGELNTKSILYFTSGWKFSPEFSSGWNTPEFNDTGWQEVNTMQNSSFPPNWNGKGWFRLHFNYDSSLFNKAVYLHIWSAGRQEIYLDGNFIAKLSDWRHPKVVTLNPWHNHVLAIKYINTDPAYYKNAGFKEGFRTGLGNVDDIMKSDLQDLRRYSNEQMFFTAITLAFGLLHLILFLFNRQFKENLIYSVFLFIYAASIFMDYQSSLASSITELILTLRIHRVLMSLTQVLVLPVLYSILKQKHGKFFWIIIAYFLFAVIAAVIKPINNFIFLQAGMILVLVESFRIITNALRQKTEGVWIIAAGFAILFIFSFYDWLLDLNLINMIGNFNNGYVYGTIGLFICMSVFLSKSFARSNQKIILQEKLNQEQEIENKFLEAENQRKSKELEDARKLQLSILPKSFPQIPHLEISARMKTAAEVGGDYYDYHLSGDGTITLAIGDATGHGIKAGIMVALIKSLFDAMAHTFFIPDFFNHCTRTIKKMNLGNLYMGMTILKIQKYKIITSAAGMPPFFIYRKNTGSIEDIILKGMPLGAFHDFQYHQKTIKVEPGDVILLLTDGFVELFNAKMEMFDVDKARDIFLDTIRKNSPDIINDLLNAANNWLNGNQQADDITFLLIKIKEEKNFP